ncbi:hypothetical protein [Jatrophihabitans fulvus]
MSYENQQPYPNQPYPNQPQGGYGYPPAQQQGNGIATAGMVCGIISVVLFWIPIVGWILAILGIVFGGVGIAKANKGAPNKGFGIAGVVCGIVSLVAYVAVVVAVINNN